jgi:YHS domain-containing protein
MEVDPDSAPAKVQDKEQIFYFCNPHCAEAFREQPQKYLERRHDSPRFAMNGSE